MTGQCIAGTVGRAAALLCLALSPGAQADADVTAAERAERGSLLFAAFNTGRSTDARFDSALGSGTDIDLEADLGLERYMTVARLSGYLWITPRQRIDFSLFDLSREASKTIEKRIVFGDRVFAIGADVNTDNELKIYKVDYTFGVLNRDRGFLGLVGGLYVARTGMSLSEPTLGTAESRQLTAPLPVVGLRGEYRFGERITLRGAAERFAIETGGIGGQLRDSYVGVDYSFGRRFALGVAYNDVAMKVSAEKRAEFQGRLDAGYAGALLYFEVDFGDAR